LHLTRTRRGLAAAATSVVVALAGASAAHAAATVTVTGDAGSPIPLAPGAPTAIRNMSPTVGIGFASTDGRFTATIAGPDGVAVASALTCFFNDNFTRTPDFRGNGNYTLTITNYAKADTTCKTATSTETYVYTVASAVTLTPPPGPFLIRAANSFATNTLSLPIALNPGAIGYDVQYAQGAVLAADGSISGPSEAGFVNSTTGTIDLSLRTPGTWTVVARAKNGVYFSPWSAPVTITAIVPFDLDALSFPDSTGPSYLLRGTVRDKTIRGTVSLALARGTKGGSYKSIGKTKISSKSTFSKRFTQRRPGTYRLRVHYAGSAAAPAVSIVSKIRITRRLTYR
jgi:opacity protein-like surface antigen